MTQLLLYFCRGAAAPIGTGKSWNFGRLIQDSWKT